MSPIFWVKMALSNSGTIVPRRAKPNSPPLSLLPGSSEYLLGQFGEVGAGLNLLEQILGLGLGRGIGLGVGARRHLDEDVAGTGLLRNRVIGLVRGEVLLNLLLAGLRNPAGQLIGGEGKVGDPALLGHGRGIARGVFLEEGLEGRRPRD